MELKNNIYVIDGLPVKDLVEKYGAPLYIYSISRMQDLIVSPCLSTITPG